MSFIFKKNKGFTIIELIIAIFLLTFGIIGIFNTFSIANTLTADSADRLTAAYLAQEGIEIVRNIRDTNWLNMDNTVSGSYSTPYSWVDGLTSNGLNNGVPCTGGCEADYTSTIMSSSNNGADYLYINNTNGLYTYNQNGATKSKFVRKIFITTVTDSDTDSNHIIKVAVQVSWDKKITVLNSSVLPASACATTGGVSNCITAVEVLYNWYNFH
ncbi:MAG: prepilin-type N-terminal cleavage/methylation domain-containing protein [Candidatus Staskawiczbacteria bacterium]|nr:prepilin-type N-terminal cleavage/methylation domain-containing protein [Candidatus Staskawiczbacteria bacterium]